MESGGVEEVHCCAVHPSAGLLAVGHADKLRLLTVLEDELRYACGARGDFP